MVSKKGESEVMKTKISKSDKYILISFLLMLFCIGSIPVETISLMAYGRHWWIVIGILVSCVSFGLVVWFHELASDEIKDKK